MQQHQAQVEQMQRQFQEMMDMRRQQQQAALQQQSKVAEEAFKLQQQNLQVNNECSLCFHIINSFHGGVLQPQM